MTLRSSARGFSLVELLVATALTMAVAAGVFTVLAPSQGAFVVQPEMADAHQRLRVGVSILTRELVLAGAGAASQAGALYHHLAPVLPYRIGDVGSDASAGVRYRPDTLSLAYVPRLPSPSSRTLSAGRSVVQIVTHSYYLRADSRTGVSQLMHYDGRETDAPVLDDVVGLGFEYFGEPQPPVIVESEGAEPRASYGPAPPPLWQDDTSGRWTAGENCTFVVQDGVHRSRLATLSPVSGVVALTPALLTDGPWCPDPAHGDRFDADLLRIRRVRVWLRVQASRSFRGPAGVLFMHAGSAASATRFVPDQEIRFDVSPRNLNLGW
jgi:hypothetical protein